MLSKITKRFAILITLFSLTSCALVKLQDDRLNETSWRLEQLGSSSVVVGREPELQFSDGKVRGSSGCNSFQGNYSLSGQSINFEELSMTLMACPDDDKVMEQEQLFFKALEVVERYDVDASSLILTTDDGNKLIFRAE